MEASKLHAKLPDRGPICIPEMDVYDSSSLGALETCPFYYYISYERNLAYEMGQGAALVWGAALHEGLAELFSTDWDLDAAIKKFYAYPEIMQVSDSKRTPAKGEAALRLYKERWAGDKTLEILRISDEVVIEYPFMIPIQGNGVEAVMAGRLDLGVKWEGRIWALDHKSTSGIYWVQNSHRPNLQFDNYVYGMHHFFGECAGLIGDYIDLSKKDDIGFYRIPSPRSMFEIKDTEQQFIAHVKQIHAHRECGLWPKYKQHCFRYNRMCEFVNLCVHNVDTGIVPKKEGSGGVE